MSKTIVIHDKTFELSIPNEEIMIAVNRVAAEISVDMKDKQPIFVCILNGSFIFAADLLKEIKLPCEVSFVKMASYAGTGSTGVVKELIGFGEDIKGRDIIIIEDIVDSGNTMEKVVQRLRESEVKSVKIATLFYKPEAYKKDIPLTYVGMKIPNDFIVGYGLDYDALGRNLKDIYTWVG
jgi:hypoxanthine phosphoribosyltransferase